MKLSQLLLELSPSFVFGEEEITGVTNDSRKVEPGFLYTAVRGTVADGHNYCASALERERRLLWWITIWDWKNR